MATPCSGSTLTLVEEGSSGRTATQQRSLLLVNLLSEDHSSPEEGGRHCILLEPYGYCWFRVGGLDHLLRRPAAGVPS